jgi:hypothetical protein
MRICCTTGPSGPGASSDGVTPLILGSLILYCLWSVLKAAAKSAGGFFALFWFVASLIMVGVLVVGLVKTMIEHDVVKKKGDENWRKLIAKLGILMLCFTGSAFCADELGGAIVPAVIALLAFAVVGGAFDVYASSYKFVTGQSDPLSGAKWVQMSKEKRIKPTVEQSLAEVERRSALRSEFLSQRGLLAAKNVHHASEQSTALEDIQCLRRRKNRPRIPIQLAAQHPRPSRPSKQPKKVSAPEQSHPLYDPDFDDSPIRF